jgi:hypothetical protein
MWETSSTLTRQVDRIGPSFATALASQGIHTLDDLKRVDARRIESIVGRHPPFGDQVHEFLSMLPQFSVRVEMESTSGMTVVFRVHLAIENKRAMVSKNGPMFAVFLASTSSDELVDYRRIKHSYL